MSGPSFIFCVLLSNFLKTIYYRYCTFPTVCSWLSCHKLIEHMCMSLLLGSLFFFIYLCFYAMSYCSYFYSFVIQFEIKKYNASNFILSRDCFCFRGILQFHGNFRISFYSVRLSWGI